jgi:hypothetical protein
MSATMTLEVEDFTGHVRRRASGVPRDATISDFVAALSRQMQLPDLDSQGRPILYGARTRDGDVLNATDRLGDVVQDEAVVQLTKTVTAG